MMDMTSLSIIYMQNKKLPQPMNLIKVVPEAYDFLDSELKGEGFGSRQHLTVL